MARKEAGALAFLSAAWYNPAMNFLKEIPFAHRGLHGGDVPENSMGAFTAAVARGYGIETDVRFTKDKRLVVFHDDGLSRMTGDPRLVSDCDLSELSALDLGKNAHIPLFSEVLEAVGGSVPLLIEIKNMPRVKGREIAAALYAAMKAYKGEYAVQSFNPLYVRAYKKISPETPCGVLGTAEKGAAKGFQAFAIKRMPLNFLVKPDFVSYRKEDLPRKSVARFKGVRLAWVVRSREEEAAARRCADNIIFEGYTPS